MVGMRCHWAAYWGGGWLQIVVSSAWYPRNIGDKLWFPRNISYELGEIRQRDVFISLIQPLSDARPKTPSAHKLLILYRFSSTYVTSMRLSSSCHCFGVCRTLGKWLLKKCCQRRNPAPNFTPKRHFCIVHYAEIITLICMSLFCCVRDKCG